MEKIVYVFKNLNDETENMDKIQRVFRQYFTRLSQPNHIVVKNVILKCTTEEYFFLKMGLNFYSFRI